MLSHAEGKQPPVSERTPLIMTGASFVETMAKPAVAAGGTTLREAVDKGGQHGLVSDGYTDEAEAVCFGYEQEAYAALARLPAIHTYTMIAFFCYFGHVWLMMQRPDIAVTIITAMMSYGLVRFWIIWASAIHGMYLLYKCDSRDPMYWQRQTRPLGAPDFNSVWHAVMIPNYKEPVGKLRQTLDTIAANSIAKQIVVCMAMEARDPNAVIVADALQAEYAGRLGGFCYSLHPIIDGEVAGKSSNENWAARCVSKYLVDTLRVPETSVVLTTCDADTFFHNNHFAFITHSFICDGEDRFHKFYFPVTNFMPNIHEVPGVCSSRYTFLSLARLAEMGCPVSTPFPLAIYSLSLVLAKKAAFWDPTVIPEDWHMYFRCQFADQGQVTATRLMMLVGTECVEGKDYVDSVKECYDQSVRWQWGAVDVGYLMVQACNRWDVPIMTRLSTLTFAYDHHLFTVFSMVALMSAPFLYGQLPVLLDMNLWTGAVTVTLLWVIMFWLWIVHINIHFFCMCLLDHKIRNDILKDRLHFDAAVVSASSKVSGWWANGPLRWLTLLTFPLADIFLFIIPTIHAHTKMFFTGGSFNYIPSAKQGERRPTGAPPATAEPAPEPEAIYAKDQNV